MNRENEKQDAIHMAEVISIGEEHAMISYCRPHYTEIVRALLDRQLGHLVAEDETDLLDRMDRGEPECTLEVTRTITTSSLTLFGPAAILAMDGCPVCAFRNIIPHIADHMAVKYGRSH